MARPIFPYELGDPDFSWLVSSFQEMYPDGVLIDTDALPVVFLIDESVSDYDCDELEEVDPVHRKSSQ